MFVCILCGGSGTRLREQTEFIPKPMIQIGGEPMLWHIMKLYAHYGFNNFVIASGYKHEIIDSYFRNYRYLHSPCAYNTATGYVRIFEQVEDWHVFVENTGENTLKGSRLKRVEHFIEGDTFMMTYGDGIGNINIPELLHYHKSHGKMVTLTGVHPEPRFGEIYHTNGRVHLFAEKPDDSCLYNGGFMVMNRGIFDYLTPNNCDLEKGPLELIAAKGELMVFHHRGFWKCMDTLKDMGELQLIWDSGKAPWRVW